LKYIKEFENLNYFEIKKLADHIQEFISHYHDNVDYTTYNGDYAFNYTIKEVQKKYFLNLRLSTNEDYMLFDINTIIQNPGWVNDKIEILSKFITFIMNKYNEFGRINCSNINNIITDITKENYEIYLNTLKYNL